MGTHDESTFPQACVELRAGHSVCLHKVQTAEGEICHGIEGVGTRARPSCPFFVDGEFVGAVGFDNTRQRRAIDSAELSTIETAAGVIGAALHRERLVNTVRVERERVAEERVAALAKANAVIRANLERLASAPDLISFLASVLLEMTREVDAASGSVILLDDVAEQWRLLAYVKEGIAMPADSSLSIPCREAAFDARLRGSREPMYLISDVAGDAALGMA